MRFYNNLIIFISPTPLFLFFLLKTLLDQAIVINGSYWLHATNLQLGSLRKSSSYLFLIVWFHRLTVIIICPFSFIKFFKLILIIGTISSIYFYSNKFPFLWTSIDLLLSKIFPITFKYLENCGNSNDQTPSPPIPYFVGHPYHLSINHLSSWQWWYCYCWSWGVFWWINQWTHHCDQSPWSIRLILRWSWLVCWRRRNN